jgi:hypothetical protein
MPRPEPLDEIQNGKTESSPDEKPHFSRRSWESCCACRIIVPRNTHICAIAFQPRP